jgi:hypothetical protein
LTIEEFRKCVSVHGFGEPSNETFIEFSQKCVKLGGITSKLEALMALTHFSSESNAFTTKSDLVCNQTNRTQLCEKYRKEQNCPSNNTYYRRGFVGLKYCYNYRQVSNELYGDQRLVINPDIVSENDSVAIDTALTYWKIKVHNKALKSSLETGRFGYTTDLLSREECAKDINRAKFKWNKFKQCLKESENGNFGVSEEGCYATVKYSEISDSYISNKNIIFYSIGSAIALILIIIILILLFMSKVKKSEKVITNTVETIDGIYDDISINSYESENKYDSIKEDHYEYMKIYEKLSLDSFSNDIYLPMKIIK